MYYAGNRKRITSFKTNDFENSSECIKYERAHPGCIIALALSKNEDLLFSGCEGGNFICWSVDNQ